MPNTVIEPPLSANAAPQLRIKITQDEVKKWLLLPDNALKLVFCAAIMSEYTENEAEDFGKIHILVPNILLIDEEPLIGRLSLLIEGFRGSGGEFLERCCSFEREKISIFREGLATANSDETRKFSPETIALLVKHFNKACKSYEGSSMTSAALEVFGGPDLAILAMLTSFKQYQNAGIELTFEQINLWQQTLKLRLITAVVDPRYVFPVTASATAAAPAAAPSAAAGAMVAAKTGSPLHNNGSAGAGVNKVAAPQPVPGAVTTEADAKETKHTAAKTAAPTAGMN